MQLHHGDNLGNGFCTSTSAYCMHECLCKTHSRDRPHAEVAFSTSMCIYNVNLKTYPKAFFTMTTLLMSLLENAIFKILKTSYRILNSISVTLLIVLLMRFFYTFVVFTSETLCNLWHGNNNFCKIE